MQDIADKLDAVYERLINEKKILMKDLGDKRFRAYREILSLLEEEDPILRKIYFFLCIGILFIISPITGTINMFLNLYRNLHHLNDANEFIKRYGPITKTGDQ